MQVARALWSLILGAAASCSILSNEADVRFRVTVVIDDHGVRRQGSKVWAETITTPLIPLVSSTDVRFVAEAVPIQLGDKSWLFVLPRNIDVSDSLYSWPIVAFGLPRASDRTRFALQQLSKKRGISAKIDCVLPVDAAKTNYEKILCPTILRSTNPRDGLSFRPISLASPTEFDGIRLTSISITITSEEPSDSLVDVAPWLREVDKVSRMKSVNIYKYLNANVAEPARDIRSPFIH